MNDYAASARVMNPGTDDEFIRLYFTCPMGHDMGSVPISEPYPSDLLARFAADTCRHYDHKREERLSNGRMV